MATIQRYHRLRNQYEHYERRKHMLDFIIIQKQDELNHLINYINQLNIKSSVCVYDHGDNLSMSSRYSVHDDDESDNDPLLQRLKLTKPSRLKTSSK